MYVRLCLQQVSNDSIPILCAPSRCPDTIHTSFLVATQPWLLRFPKHLPANEVDDQSANDANECNAVQPVYRVMEDLHPDSRSPEITGQQTNIEKGCAGEAEHEWRKRVEQGEHQCVASEVPPHFAVPGGRPEGAAIEDARLRAIDDHAPETKLANDLVKGTFGDQKFFDYIAHSVEGCAKKCKEVAFDLITARDRPKVRNACDVVAR